MNAEGRLALALVRAASIGDWFIRKAQTQAREAGYQQAARNLRKQGVPLEIALAIFFNRPLRSN